MPDEKTIGCRSCGLLHAHTRRRCPFSHESIQAPANREPVHLDGELAEGRYEVRGLIGEGGMGSVFDARDTATGARVAIKVLHARLASNDQARRRFALEAKAAALVEHPNVVRVLNAGTRNDDLPFLVMEHVDGETLADRLERDGPMPVDEVLELARGLVGGLAAAHSVGVVHRDVKPENLLLGPDGVKLVDFGIARMLHGMVRFTVSGEIVGTPAYFAPEQALAQEVDARTDSFGCAVVLYEALTDELPFKGERVATIVGNLLRTEPTPIGEVCESVDPRLEAAIAAGLIKDRQARPAAGALLELLDRD